MDSMLTLKLHVNANVSQEHCETVHTVPFAMFTWADVGWNL